MGFLDNLSKSLSQGVDRAKFEAEKLQRSTKLRGEINDLQQQMDTNLRQLGERTMALYQQGQIQAPEIGSLAQMIEQVRLQLAAKQQELTAVQNEPFAGGMTPDQNYGQPAAGTPPAVATNTCPTCQAELPANAAFCGNCGARISS